MSQANKKYLEIINGEGEKDIREITVEYVCRNKSCLTQIRDEGDSFFYDHKEKMLLTRGALPGQICCPKCQGTKFDLEPII